METNRDKVKRIEKEVLEYLSTTLADNIPQEYIKSTDLLWLIEKVKFLYLVRR